MKVCSEAVFDDTCGGRVQDEGDSVTEGETETVEAGGVGLEVGTCLGVGCLRTYLGGRLRFEGAFLAERTAGGGG